MSHYKSNLRDIEFNLFEVLGATRSSAGPFADVDSPTRQVRSWAKVPTGWRASTSRVVR
jgi:hypothetical protein